jgi:hypothetical protein
VGRSLCALAEGGTLFAWAAASPQGEASAAGSVMTGLDSANHPLEDDGQSFLPESITTLAETFDRAGYRTAAFVASPRLNRSRRLDQGFDHYDDAAATGRASNARGGLRDGPAASAGAGPQDASNPHESIALANRIQNWFTARDAPRFVWIHADREAGLAEFDRLISRLAQILDPETDRPGLLFAALRGEPSEDRARLDWRAIRIPLLFRPPADAQAGLPRVSQRLASLLDIAVTLRSAARLPPPGPPVLPLAAAESDFQGRDLRRLARAPAPQDATPANEGLDERFVYLSAPSPVGEVGLASERHLYARERSPLDGTGRPIPAESLSMRGARFAALPIVDRLRHPAPRSAALDPSPWRSDVLDGESPVPRLEFHLARRLGHRPVRGNGERPDSTTAAASR